MNIQEMLDKQRDQERQLSEKRRYIHSHYNMFTTEDNPHPPEFEDWWQKSACLLSAIQCHIDQQFIEEEEFNKNSEEFEVLNNDPIINWLLLSYDRNIDIEANEAERRKYEEEKQNMFTLLESLMQMFADGHFDEAINRIKKFSIYDGLLASILLWKTRPQERPYYPTFTSKGYPRPVPLILNIMDALLKERAEGKRVTKQVIASIQTDLERLRKRLALQ